METLIKANTIGNLLLGLRDPVEAAKADKGFLNTLKGFKPVPKRKFHSPFPPSKMTKDSNDNPDFRASGSNAWPLKKILLKEFKNEQKGQLDLLVNNAYSGFEIINKGKGNPFYKCPTPNMRDKINGVGLRNHYLCTVYASSVFKGSW
ncbi:DHRS1 [Lepeophtheirus salmonis]|uniref:DHRS1 n=1 Tax=Lepeophtheirus salmonis TaxID=72036 RepID=A0A817FCC6_LEPSM|nr:DHRS1 [Lepeophtheirus salmonis]